MSRNACRVEGNNDVNGGFAQAVKARTTFPDEVARTEHRRIELEREIDGQR